MLSHGLNIRVPAATADVAVQSFYLVSGFYMGLVLTEKYHHLSSFFINRFARLYPAYFVVLVITLAHSLVRWQLGRSAVDPGLVLYETHFQPLDLPGKTYLVGTNLLLWGQDIALFLTLSGDGHSLDFTSNFMATEPHVERFLLVPQAWSLSIEMGFYLLAPWLVRRSTPMLAGVLAITLAARIWLASIGLSFDPWTYRLFPVEVGSFVLGVLIHRSMGRRTVSTPLQYLATAGLLLLTLTLSAIPGGWIVRVVFYAYCAWALPLAFQLTKRNRVDRYLGELSYPIYLSHLLVISVALYTGWTGMQLAGLIVVLVLGASIALHEAVQRPVDRLRARWVA